MSPFRPAGTPLTCPIIVYRLIRSPGLAGPTTAGCTTPRVLLMRGTSSLPAVVGASLAPPTMTRTRPYPPVLVRVPLATTGTQSTLNIRLVHHHRIPLPPRSPLPIPPMGRQ
ncbi:MAG: hypothetical protein ACFFCZ_23530 [Promethearchaeota archaeon]